MRRIGNTRPGPGWSASWFKTLAAVTSSIAAIGVLAGPAAAEATLPISIPEGYSLGSSERLGDGVDRVRLVRESPSQSVHVARIAAGAPFRLRAVLSGDAVAEAGPRLERTSSMCSRLRCLVAVNADFAQPGTDEPLGATIAQGEMLRSPSPSHHQLLVGDDGRLAAGGLDWRGTIVGSDLRSLSVDGVNRPRSNDQLVLYTPANGPVTGTNGHGIEVPYTVVQPTGPVRLGYTAMIELVRPVGGGSATIPKSGGVLSGHGRAAVALADLLRRADDGTATRRVLLRLETGAALSESVGGSPVLLRAGRRWFGDDPGAFVRSRHPRTAVGWTPDGHIFLVVVDGRRAGAAEGMSLAELADLFAALGASDAINLDGGGSSTFVVRGQVVNAPSDRAVQGLGGTMTVVPTPARGQQVVGDVERPVVSALAVVPATSRLAPTGDAFAGDAFEVLPAPPSIVANDPASNPEVALPAIVAFAPRPSLVPAGAAALTILALVIGALVATLRRSGWPRRVVTSADR